MELEEQSPGFSGRDPDHHPSCDCTKDNDKHKEHCYELIDTLVALLWFVRLMSLVKLKFLDPAFKPDAAPSHTDSLLRRTAALWLRSLTFWALQLLLEFLGMKIPLATSKDAVLYGFVASCGPASYYPYLTSWRHTREFPEIQRLQTSQGHLGRPDCSHWTVRLSIARDFGWGI